MGNNWGVDAYRYELLKIFYWSILESSGYILDGFKQSKLIKGVFVRSIYLEFIVEFYIKHFIHITFRFILDIYYCLYKLTFSF